MSTKAIREVLAFAARINKVFDADTVAAALAEVEAIEKAAARIQAWRRNEGPTPYEAYALLDAIAAQRNAGTDGAVGPKDGASGPQE